MTLMIKIIGIGMVGTFLSAVLKKYRPEAALAVALAASIAIFAFAAGLFGTVVEIMESLCATSGIDIAYFAIILKIIGIAYLTQLASEVSKDAGEGAIASKIELGGKLCIIAMSAPILLSLVELLGSLMP
jgi:stage III sporulation protein AD